MDPWGAEWQPAVGDDVEVDDLGNGTISRVRGDRFEVAYEPVVFDVQPDGTRSPVPAEPETGWHSRDELRPVGATLVGLIRRRAAM